VNLRDVPREFKELPLGLIDEPVLPSRSSMDETAMDELTASIRIDGLQQPMVVARVADRYEVIAGHRRRLACGRAGLVAAPCIIYPSKDAALVAVQFWENYGREELNAADEALWFSELLERDCGADVDVLCERLRKKRSYVEGRLLLFSGDKLVFEQLQAGKIPIGVAQELNRCSNERYRRYLLDSAIRGGATITVVKGWIQDWQRSEQYTPASPAAATDAPAPASLPAANPFTCECCGGTDNAHLIVWIPFHQHCKLAILDKVLAAYRSA
jgi:ParB family chromosome partitioning protein